MASYKRVVLTERDHFLQEQPSTTKKQLEKFDNSYTSKKLNELYEEFDAITFNTPSISSNTITQVNALVEQQTGLSFRTKLYLSSAIVITMLLAFLAIFNIFVINNLNAGISLLQEEITTTETDYAALYDYYNELRNSSNITQRVTAEGFSQVSSNSVISIPLTPTYEVSNVQAQTNWFNELCNFLGGLLGG